MSGDPWEGATFGEIEAALNSGPAGLAEMRSLSRAAWRIDREDSRRFLLINTADSFYIPALEAERDRLAAARKVAGAALAVITVGGNGEGWTMTDAINLLRYAIGEAGITGGWTQAVSVGERRMCEQIVGAEVIAALTGETAP